MKKRTIWSGCLVAFLFLFCACQNGKESQNADVQDTVAEEQGVMEEKNITAEEQDASWDMHITEETIEVDGLAREYTFLFLTDTHMVVSGSEDSDQIAEYTKQRLAEFGNEENVASADQFEQWIDYANRQQVDGLLLGGDIIDSPSAANIGHLEEHLEKLEIPYLYTPGNHDWTFPWEYMTQYGRETYRPMLEPFMQSDCAIHELEFEDFIIVAVDNSSNQIDPEAMEKYREILRKNKPVILMLHVPLLTQSVLTKAKEVWSSAVVLGGGNYGGIYPDEVSAEFIDLTTAEDSPVTAVLAGHVHFYDKDVINEKIIQIVGDAGYKGSAVLLRVIGKN